MTRYTVYFEGYIWVYADSDTEAEIAVDEKLRDVADKYSITETVEAGQ